MKWIGRRQSDNVEDRRTGGSARKIALGGGGVAIVFFLLKMFMGGENAQLLDQIQSQVQGQQTEASSENTSPLSPEDEKMGNFVRVCLADTEDVWTAIFQENNMEYEAPKLVLFRDAVETACGSASAASGPFYCPGDKTVYMDLVFFEELKSRFGAKGGDFAIAYVIAHEIGHHIQTILGTSGKMRQLQQGKSETEANRLSVCLELQADFYAGVWAKHNQQNLDIDDIDEALSAAQAVGDDAIQSKMQGHVEPDTFTHGSSEQRKYWFMKGYKTGDIQQGDTFSELR